MLNVENWRLSSASSTSLYNKDIISPTTKTIGGKENDAIMYCGVLHHNATAATHPSRGNQRISVIASLFALY